MTNSRLFRHENRERSHDTRRVYALFELAHTCVDFGAALCFIIGSVMFFYDDLMTAATWLFLIGSVLFAVKPTLRLIREIKLISMGDAEDVASRLET
ncbi:YrhK family protein [Pseudooceanicola onchidii]|uniref:YrhK family protein n=1 Tax=Pseudooceanicola onchidii TaxID=2562279 RepID=UPI0010AAE928|nr:YrhK family protein [Pseudooceanicola onchidii]